jgi:hypothetical protein
MKKIPCTAYLKKLQALANMQGASILIAMSIASKHVCFLLAQEMNQQLNQLFVKSEQQRINVEGLKKLQVVAPTYRIDEQHDQMDMRTQLSVPLQPSSSNWSCLGRDQVPPRLTWKSS